MKLNFNEIRIVTAIGKLLDEGQEPPFTNGEIIKEAWKLGAREFLHSFEELESLGVIRHKDYPNSSSNEAIELIWPTESFDELTEETELLGLQKYTSDEFDIDNLQDIHNKLDDQIKELKAVMIADRRYLSANPDDKKELNKIILDKKQAMRNIKKIFDKKEIIL